MTLSVPGIYKGQPEKIARLWIHECQRVYNDRLIFEKDVEIYSTALKEGARCFELSNEILFAEPNIFTPFHLQCLGHDSNYFDVIDYEQLKGVLDGKLKEYNDNVSSMNLVLFTQAMEHICRISRIVSQPSGNALLIGVGGSGKQSLSKLAAYLLEMDIYRIMPNASYGMNELRADLEAMYSKAGVGGSQVLFLLTDSQIVNEKFLVYINDMLSSGWVPDMFPKDELDAVLGKIRNEAKSQGYQDTPDQLFEFFKEKCLRNLHIALCFSPVGEAFRVRARKFPGVINCTHIDWFHEWPKDALIDVASRFLVDIDVPDEDIRTNIGQHMAYVHISIEQANKDFLAKERR